MEKQTHRYFSTFVRAISRYQFKHEMEVTQLKLSGIADEKATASGLEGRRNKPPVAFCFLVENFTSMILLENRLASISVYRYTIMLALTVHFFKTPILTLKKEQCRCAANKSLEQTSCSWLYRLVQIKWSYLDASTLLSTYRKL